MRIIEIEHKPEMKIKGATVHLNYDDIITIHNALYQESKNEENTKRETFNRVDRDMFLLCELVKNGCIDNFTISHICEIQGRNKKEK